MPTPAEPKKRMALQPPSGATHWALWRVTSKHNASGNPGRRDKCVGEPGEDGKVPDSWPVADFSTANVLAHWGDGKYRVDWYDAGGVHLKGMSQIFEVATPKKKGGGGRLRPPPRVGSVDDEASDARLPAAVAAGAAPIGVLDMLAMLRAEGDAVREREQQSGERMLQFMMQMSQQQTQLLTTLMAQGQNRSGAGEAELLRRELQQTMREQMFALRQEITANAPTEDDPDDPDPDEPPRDLQEAAERIGMAFLGDLEQRAPHLIQEFIPKMAEFFKASGVRPSPELQQRAAAAAAAAAANGHANGR